MPLLHCLQGDEFCVSSFILLQLSLRLKFQVPVPIIIVNASGMTSSVDLWRDALVVVQAMKLN